MEKNYNQGKIYKIVCNITNEIYIGSTILELKERLRLHKTGKDCVCRNIINRGDYKIELIKDYPCNNRRELLEEESKYIRENKCINIQIPNRTDKEWREDNKEKLKNYEENRKEDKKEYYKNNKEKIKEYYENNKEKIKEYYENNKEKITCECGAIVLKTNIAQHKKSMKHIKLTECIILD